MRPLRIAGLHENWAQYHSLFNALGSGRRLNIIALGKILVTLAVIQGPLLQRTSRTVGVMKIRPTTVKLGVQNRFLSLGFTGYTFGR